MSNPFSFHRKMIFKIKDNKSIKEILNKWYDGNVKDNIQKLHKEENINKQQQNYVNSKIKSFNIRKDKKLDKSRYISISEMKHYNSSPIRINEN